MSWDIYSIAYGLIWIAQICYVLGLVPQIFKNIKMGSAAGVSDVLLIGFLNGYFAIFYYLFGLGLPSPYKVMNTLQFFALLGLVFQRIHYDETESYKRFEYCLWGNSAMALFFVPIALSYPVEVGNIAGWIAVVLFSISYVAQILHVYITKSVVGFSIFFVVIITIGVLLELIAANVLGLPGQTHATLWRALVVCGIFLYQFWLYG